MADGLLRMITVGLVACGGLSTTYFVPQLGDYRPWVEGEAVPFAMWWSAGSSPVEELPGFGGKAYASDAEREAEGVEEAGVSEALMAEALEAEAETQSGDEDEELLAPPPAPVEPTPAPVVEPEPVSPSAPVEPGEPVEPVEPVEPPKPRVVIDPKEYEGLTYALERPEALHGFFQALEKTALKEEGAVTRISHWGASVIGADGMTSVARRKLQKRFGSAGKGWVNMTPGWSWYRQKDVVFESKGWKGRTVTSNRLKDVRHGKRRYGLGGVAAIGYRGAKTKYRVYADRLELWYHGFPKGGELTVRVDSGEPIPLSTRTDSVQDRWQVFEAPKKGGEHVFEVKATGSGPAHVYGVTLERDGPGVTYDCIGMIGTRASRILNYDPKHLSEQVAHRDPSLQIIMFGGNELVDRKMNLRVYEEKYTTVIERLRAGAPSASCMLMTPVDHGEKHRGRVRTVPLLKKMIPIQRRIAEKAGCAFFNTFEAMGGEGAMGRWYYKVKPRLAWGDFAHLTKAGDRVMGAMIYKTIMKGFADWLASTRPSAAPESP